ncbi:transketolase [Candidatus Planktophila versatilis]|uniref:transketolase n=1 Tax=Candidatus Planktophila versatilis TaxID=1884905 RepID=UPI000BACBA8C|nr:transketolase [Candidatus Planktophila versatilis]ASY25864.1 transketolase [Candidatus Planktophila versatilis]
MISDTDVARGVLLAQRARKSILEMTHRAQVSHVASALSVVDILAAIYARPSAPKNHTLNDLDREIVILSKGHSAAALYAVLSELDFFPRDWLAEYCNDSARLGGHVTSKDVPGVELSTGSLGHGLPYGLGVALSRKISNVMSPVVVVISDGECNEGTTWESALIANRFKLDNLIVVIDRNRIQSLDLTENTIPLEPLGEKWKSFGWQVSEIDGHSIAEIQLALETRNTCKVLIANTIKGKGVSFMENSVKWHYKPPTDQELELALLEVLGIED